MTALAPYLTVRAGDLVLRVKAVPGAKRDAIVGALGDRLKIRVAAPPEDGQANAAIRALLARVLALDVRAIELEHGASSPLKLLVLRNAATRHTEIAAALAPLV